MASAWESTEAAFKSPRRLADVIATGLDDYAAIFIPGGHGAMNVIPFAEDVQAALDHFQNDDKLIITLGHDRGLAAGVRRVAPPARRFRSSARFTVGT